MGRREKRNPGAREMGGSGNSGKKGGIGGMSKGKCDWAGVKSRNGVCPRRELGETRPWI